jgi:hypothetical protein
MKKIIPTALIVIEGVITTIPFLLSWWVSAVYQSVVAGWLVAGMKSAEKRKALAELLSGE